MKGYLTLGGEHVMQYSDEVLQNCTLGIYIILLTDITNKFNETFFKSMSKNQLNEKE